MNELQDDPQAPASDDDGGSRTEQSGPSDRGQRIVLLDILRGFALLSVLVANMIYTAGDAVVAVPDQDAPQKIDKYIVLFLVTSVYGKPRAIFSFLFGLGFALQILSAERKGAEIVPRFLRRMGWLFVFGILNMVFLWFGDILHVYAIMGLVLLAFRHQKSAVLLSIGLILTVSPLIQIQRDLFGQPVTRSEEMREHRLEVFSQGSYLDVVQEHIDMGFEQHSAAGWMSRCAFEAFGYFLFGYYVGRRRFMLDISKHLKSVRKLLLLGLGVGLVGDVLFVLGYRFGVDWGLIGKWVVLTVIQANTPAKALFLVCGFILLVQVPWWSRTLSVLAPLGRMALTNYLLASVFIALVLYGSGPGLGLIGQIKPLMCVPISFVITAAQIAFSTWWMNRFRFGPMEWLWRSLTYGTWQPMRISSGNAISPQS